MDDFGTGSYSGAVIAGTVAPQIAHLILLAAGPGQSQSDVGHIDLVNGSYRNNRFHLWFSGE
jgi:hypothetical protein